MTLTDALAELGIPFARFGESPHVSRDWVGIDCDGCSPGSHKYKRGINLRSLRTSCWTCGPARLGETLAAAAGVPIRVVMALLPGLEGDRTPTDAHTARGRYTEPAGLEPLAGAHARYVRESRGMDPAWLARVWGVRAFGPLVPAYRWRLFLPVVRDGVPVSWTTRAIGAAGPRYLSAPPAMESAPIHDCLYGEDFIRHSVIVVEGPFDALRIGPGAVATFGVNVTPVQIARLSTVPVRAVCFDSEPAAQRRASVLCDQLALYPGVTHKVTLSSGKDPGEASEEDISELRRTFLEGRS